jgi:hypothetical protein
MRLDQEDGFLPRDLDEPDFKIIKEPVRVRLMLDGEDPVEGELFLLPHSGLREGRERVIDRLLGHDSFLPFRPAAELRLINKQCIVAVWVEDPLDAGQSPGPVDREIQVTCWLARCKAGRERVSGRVRISAPSSRARLADHLNEEEPFLCLLGETEAILVNKRYLQRAMEERSSR